MGRPIKYKTSEELSKKIDEYFMMCNGIPLKDDNGTVLCDKSGTPLMINVKPPTVTGLALFLGFKSRQALLNYQGRKQFNDAVTRAKLRIEAYAEERLFDKDGVKGAMFTLERNFKNWGAQNEANADVLEKLDEILSGLDEKARS